MDEAIKLEIKLKKEDAALILREDGEIEFACPGLEDQNTSEQGKLVTVLAILLGAGDPEFMAMLKNKYQEYFAADGIISKLPNIKENIN
jgi:hypothetical protein